MYSPPPTSPTVVIITAMIIKEMQISNLMCTIKMQWAVGEVGGGLYMQVPKVYHKNSRVFD
jgi:ABC-type uncharacterized transport system ATPase component